MPQLQLLFELFNFFFENETSPPCDVQHRRELWESLKQLKNMNPDGIWCLMGDFNSIRNTSERVGLSQKGVEDRHMTDFNECKDPAAT